MWFNCERSDVEYKIRMVLTLSMLGKNFIRRHFKIFFSYFALKIGFSISCNGDNLHEISKPVLDEISKLYQSLDCFFLRMSSLWKE